MKEIMLWIDDERTPVCGGVPARNVIWCKSVNEAIAAYTLWGFNLNDKDVRLTRISLDHDAGFYQYDGGDYIKFLDWVEKYHSKDIPLIKWDIHSMNPVGRENMARILRKYGVNI